MESLPIELLIQIKKILERGGKAGDCIGQATRTTTQTLVKLASTSRNMRTFLFNNAQIWEDCNEDMLAIIVHHLPLKVRDSISPRWGLFLKDPSPTATVLSSCSNLISLNIDIESVPSMKMVEDIFAAVARTGQKLALKSLNLSCGLYYLSPKTAKYVYRIASVHLKKVCTDLIVYPTVCKCRKGFCNYEHTNPNRAYDYISSDSCYVCSVEFDLVCTACEKLPSCKYSWCNLYHGSCFSIMCRDCAVEETCDFCQKWFCDGCSNEYGSFAQQCYEDGCLKVCCDQCAKEHGWTMNIDCAEGHGGISEYGCPDHPVGETCADCKEFFCYWDYDEYEYNFFVNCFKTHICSKNVSIDPCGPA